MESPWAVLDLEPGAPDAAIDRAYRERVKETHPDLGGSTAAFRRVRRAYEALNGGASDPERDARDEPTTVEYLNYDVLADHGWSLEDPDLFAKASAADVPVDDRGRLVNRPDESLLEAAENRGFAWPYSCRGGACANCAVAVLDGELTQPVDHILPQELLERGIRLSCVGCPATERASVVYNVKHLPALEDLLLPPGPFDWRTASD